MGFFGGLFGGSNPTLGAGMKTAGDTASFSTGLGKNLSSQAGSFWSDIMSGDPTKTAKLLAPQIASQQKQTQQAKANMANFGNRSGGTTAKGQTMDDTARANLTSAISTLTGTAAGEATSMGKDMMDLGMQSLGQQVNFSQQQMENWSNSIFGQAMAQGVGTAMSFIPTGGG